MMDENTKIALFSVTFAVLLIFGFLNLTKGSITGNVVAQAEGTAMNFIFLLIAALAGGLLFIVMVYSRSK